jgi:acyl-coenzyme A synthetase/AMP-(fatty) acid ligase/aryl carrier-like protein
MFFPALCSGGVLHVVSQARAADPTALAAYFKRHPIDCLKLVPTHLTALLSAAPTADILPCRQLILGGEAASWVLIETVRKLAPACAILNHYGPTETTVGVLTYPVPPAHLDHRAAAPPLGRPLANTQVYILGADLHPVPLGTPGELHVGGASVTRGYFARPELTAEKFIPDPFSARAGARLYKTGDRARYLPGGDVEFLGRTDQQVKIRGYRVELREIEQTLLRHPAVREVAVVAQEDVAGDKRLLAYVVPVAAASVAGNDLRDHARTTLPDYMMPAAFILLDALPLSPNGKLDRRALPTADSFAAEPTAAHVMPQSEAEKMIATVWREALHIEHVSVRDNFFDLGGHSLIMLQIQSKLRALFGRDISIVEMFEHPTIQSLAQHLSAAPSTAQPDRHLHDEADARRQSLSRRRQLNQD